MTTPTSTLSDDQPEVLVRAKSPEEIARVMQRIETIKLSKKDYIAPARRLSFRANFDDDAQPTGVSASLDLGQVDGAMHMPPMSFGIRPRAHSQLAQKLGIHGHYARRMRDEAPDLLATNLNYWAEREPKDYLVRTLDGDVRAMLSPGYRILDSSTLAFHAFDTCREVGAQVVQLDLTDDNFYLRALVPDWAERIDRAKTLARSSGGSLFQDFDDRGGIHKSPVDAPIGQATGQGGNSALRASGFQDDTLVPGIVISNSETGQGSVRVDACAFRPYCRNTAIFGDSFARAHLGPKHELQGILSDETIDAENQALWLQIRDVIRATFDRDAFRLMVEKFSLADGEVLESPVKAVEQVADHYDLPEAMKQRILDEIITEGDPTTFGLVNALTAIARDEENPTTAVELERHGADLLDKGRELVAIRV